MFLEPAFKYNLTETLYSGQAFRWSPIASGTDLKGGWHEAIINRKRVRLRQTENEIQVGELENTPENLDLISRYLRIDDNLSAIYSEISHPVPKCTG